MRCVVPAGKCACYKMRSACSGSDCGDSKKMHRIIGGDAPHLLKDIGDNWLLCTGSLLFLCREKLKSSYIIFFEKDKKTGGWFCLILLLLCLPYVDFVGLVFNLYKIYALFCRNFICLFKSVEQFPADIIYLYRDICLC